MSKTVRRYFITGLLIVLPVFLTLYFLFVIFAFIDGIWGKLINIYLKKHLGFAIPGLGFILGIATVFLTGFVATNFLGKRLFHLVETWFLKFPFIKQIYPSAKQIVNSFVSKERPAFQKVVMVEYPAKGVWSVGFLTNESFSKAEAAAAEKLLHVFIATTPSPFTGFLVLIPKDRVKFLDISVEEGIKLIVSGGIVNPR